MKTKEEFVKLLKSKGLFAYCAENWDEGDDWNISDVNHPEDKPYWFLYDICQIKNIGICYNHKPSHTYEGGEIFIHNFEEAFLNILNLPQFPNSEDVWSAFRC